MAGLAYDRSYSPRTFQELYSALSEAVKESGETVRVEILKRYINSAHLDMHIGRGEKFPWAQKTAVLATVPQYTTGTVSVTKGSQICTGTGTSWFTTNTGLANISVGMRATPTPIVGGGKFVISGHDVPYTNLTDKDVGASQSESVKFSQTYAGETNATAQYRYFEDTYLLPADFLKPIDQQSFSDDHSIRIISRQEFRRRNPRISNVGTPAYCTFFQAPYGGLGGKLDAGVTSTDERMRTKIQFNLGTNALLRISFTYVTSNIVTSTTDDSNYSLSESFVLDSDEPLMPNQYRYAIVLKALTHYFRDQNDDVRSQEASAQYDALMTRVIGDNSFGAADKPQIQPRAARHNQSRAKRPYSRRYGHRYDLNGEFDRFER